jgi:hypothetical protein
LVLLEPNRRLLLLLLLRHSAVRLRSLAKLVCPAGVNVRQPSGLQRLTDRLLLPLPCLFETNPRHRAHSHLHQRVRRPESINLHLDALEQHHQKSALDRRPVVIRTRQRCQSGDPEPGKAKGAITRRILLPLEALDGDRQLCMMES